MFLRLDTRYIRMLDWVTGGLVVQSGTHDGRFEHSLGYLIAASTPKFSFSRSSEIAVFLKTSCRESQ